MQDARNDEEEGQDRADERNRVVFGTDSICHVTGIQKRRRGRGSGVGMNSGFIVREGDRSFDELPTETRRTKMQQF